MGIDLTPLWVLFKIIVFVALVSLCIAGYLFFSKTNEIVSKKRIEPKLIIEQVNGKSDTTFIYLSK